MVKVGKFLHFKLLYIEVSYFLFLCSVFCCDSCLSSLACVCCLIMILSCFIFSCLLSNTESVKRVYVFMYMCVCVYPHTVDIL